MKCPHCMVQFHEYTTQTRLGSDADGDWVMLQNYCPACKKLVLRLASGIWREDGPDGPALAEVRDVRFIRPNAIARESVPAQVPQEFAANHLEAALILAQSPKASAALSRRCIEDVLAAMCATERGNLARAIQQAIDSGRFPPFVTKSLEAVKSVGNFPAHPLKSERAGEIVPVERGEAELNLDVLECLFDFLFVQPDLMQRKLDALSSPTDDSGIPLL